MTKTASPPSAISKMRAFTLRSLLIYLCVASIFTLIFKGVLINDAKEELATLKSTQEARLSVTRHRMELYFNHVLSDLRLLAHAPSMQRLIKQDNAANRNDVARLFQTLAQEKKIYDQVRYLSNDGREEVRIDLKESGAIIVAPEQLQDKSNRYYVQQTIALAPGEIYISPIDLNIEQGMIEQPYKPMVRFGIALFDNQGQRHGILILNFYGQVLLNEFHTSMADTQTSMLLNNEGDWLISPNPSQEWGFMFGHPGDFTRNYPDLWQKMTLYERGFIEDSLGLFSFDTVRPLRATDAVDQIPIQGYTWKAVSLVPTDQLPTANLARNRPTLMVYLGGLFLLLLLVLLLSASLQAKRKLFLTTQQSAKRYREITENLGEGLLVLDHNGYIREANSEAIHLLGWTRQELIGAKAHSMIHFPHEEEGTEAEQQCPILNVISSGVPYSSYDESFMHKSGSRFPVRVNAAPVTSADGLGGTVVSFQDITVIKRIQDETHRLAFQDPLTGLPNRRLLQDRLRNALFIAQRHGGMLGLMFLDLDRFKPVNDSYGHDYGDELLKQIANRLLTLVRRSDTVSRQGGDEFVILLPDLDAPADAEKVAQKILTSLNEAFEVFGQQLQIGVSIGIATYPDAGDSANDLVLKADHAMYAAKQAGRNCYRLSPLEQGKAAHSDADATSAT